MRIAVDVMGGDFAPHEVVNGSVDALSSLDADIALVGDEEAIRRVLDNHPLYTRFASRIQVIHAPEVIAMDEHPATAVRRKRNSSIVVAAGQVKEGHCQALVAAGNTGAAMAASLFAYGRAAGVDRPAIATPMPTAAGMALIIDAGANADVKPKNLLQFGMMGSAYQERVKGVPRPRVGLLNIGSESTKGNELCQAAYPLLAQSSLNFVGNIEGRDIPEGKADVVVCDGFVGNIVLKFAEGLGTMLFSAIRREAGASLTRKVGALLMRPAFGAVRKSVDYAEYGGAPLLGLDGLTIICHGSSRARAIENAVKAAARSVEGDVVSAISSLVKQSEEGIKVD